MRGDKKCLSGEEGREGGISILMLNGMNMQSFNSLSSYDKW